MLSLLLCVAFAAFALPLAGVINEKGSQNASHTYLHTHTHIMYTLIHTHTHTHNCSAALRHFDWSSTRCVLKILLCNYPLPLTRLPQPVCHLPLGTTTSILLLLSSPLFPLMLAALPFRCLFAYCAKISLEPTICSLLFFRSGCSPRGVGEGAHCRQMRHATPPHRAAYIPTIYAIHGTETDSTGARHALP